MEKLVYFLLCVLLISSCEFSATTAKITESKICGSLNAEAGCENNVDVFHEIPDTVFVTAKLRNAPKGTEVRYYWYQFLQGEYILLDSVSYRSEHSSELLKSYISTQSLPLGKYRVVTKIMSDNRNPITKDFELVVPDGISMHLARIGNSIDEFGKVSQVKTNLSEEDRIVYFSSYLYNLPANALINVVFKDMSNGKIEKELNIKNGADAEDVILLRANLNRDQVDLKSGYHQNIVSINGESFGSGYIIL